MNRQDNEESIRRLAFSVFCLTKHLEWQGGRGSVSFPLSRSSPSSFAYWTLSPEVTLLGYQVQVCVLSLDNGFHQVRIYVDQEMKFPGGSVMNNDRLPFLFDLLRSLTGKESVAWSRELARQERRDGGKTGPIHGADRFIAEAQRLMTSTASDGRLTLLDNSVDETDAHPDKTSANR